LPCVRALTLFIDPNDHVKDLHKEIVKAIGLLHVLSKYLDPWTLRIVVSPVPRSIDFDRYL